METNKIIFSLLFIFLSVLLFSACGDDSPTEPLSNPYSGTWSIVFAGDYTGGGQMSIDSNGKFSLSVLLQDSDGSTFTNVIEGSVSSSGSMSADIFYAGSKIGTTTGKFADKSGSGTWQTSQPTSGTWVVSKQ